MQYLFSFTQQKVVLIGKKSANGRVGEKAVATRLSDAAEKFQMFQSGPISRFLTQISTIDKFIYQKSKLFLRKDNEQCCGKTAYNDKRRQCCNPKSGEVLAKGSC